jgi:hypothetical protein
VVQSDCAVKVIDGFLESLHIPRFNTVMPPEVELISIHVLGVAFEARRLQATLGVQVQPAPFFAINLRRIARRISQGARKDASSPIRPLDSLGLSEDPEARKVLEKYRSVPSSYRRLLPPEAFCHAAGVPPPHILEVVTIVAMRCGVIASTILAATMNPRVVKKTIEQALQTDGFKERLLLLKASGLVPTWAGRIAVYNKLGEN